VSTVFLQLYFSPEVLAISSRLFVPSPAKGFIGANHSRGQGRVREPLSGNLDGGTICGTENCGRRNFILAVESTFEYC